MRPEFVVFLAAYLIALVFIGLKFSRRMTGLDDFFLASRSLPAGLVFLSLTASWFGATSIIVTTDRAFEVGVSASWLVGVPAVVTVILLALFLAGPVRRPDVQTLPALVEARYGRPVRHAVSVLILWYMITLASSQMVALAQFLRPFLRLPYVWGLGLGTAVVLAYLLSGGLRSVVATDVLQCFLLIIGLAGLAVHIARSSPYLGLAGAARRAADSGAFQFFFDGRRNVLISLSFILAWMISPIAWQRIQAAGSVKKARQGLFAAAGAFAVLYGLVVFIGVFSRPLFSLQPPGRPLISEFVASQTGVLAGGLLFIAVTAAVLSTLDTALNSAAMIMAKNVFCRAPGLFGDGPRGAVRSGRMATVIVAVLAFGIAVRMESILQTLGMASEIMAEGLFVPGMALFVLKKRTPLAGALGLILGGGFAFLSFLCTLKILPLVLPAWPFSVPYGFALSVLGFAAGYMIDHMCRHRSAGV